METNIVPASGRFNFKPFRIFENHVLLLNSILTTITPLLNELIRVYGDDAILQEWKENEIKVNKYIESNHSITELEKAFNSSVKWF